MGPCDTAHIFLLICMTAQRGPFSLYPYSKYHILVSRETQAHLASVHQRASQYFRLTNCPSRFFECPKRECHLLHGSLVLCYGLLLEKKQLYISYLIVPTSSMYHLKGNLRYMKTPPHKASYVFLQVHYQPHSLMVGSYFGMRTP